MLPRGTTPVLDDGAIGWIRRYARRHHWRVADWIDYEDLVQDGCALFLRCRVLRPDIKRQSYLMSYFKRAYTNLLNDLSLNRTRRSEVKLDEYLGDLTLDDILEPEPETATLYTAMRESPDELQRLLALFVDDPNHILDQPFHRDSRGIRETTNEWFCRCIGANPERVDLVGMLAFLLGQGDGK